MPTHPYWIRTNRRVPWQRVSARRVTTQMRDRQSWSSLSLPRGEWYPTRAGSYKIPCSVVHDAAAYARGISPSEAPLRNTLLHLPLFYHKGVCCTRTQAESHSPPL